MNTNEQSLENTIPLPPKDFQALVCGPADTSSFERMGRLLVVWADNEGMLKPGTDFLDVGCGCGRLARYLLPWSINSYTGFDRHAGMIEWCRREIRDPRFRFDFFELKSVYTAWDQQAGTLDVEDFAFPYAADAFDACMLASVFTHMPPNEARHYLGELARVTRPGGKILLSIFFSKSGAVETRDDGVNVLHNPQEFLTDLEQSPFDVRRVSPLSFGYEHNWYVLTKR
jgi:SAM-dependent methyltransferase